MIETHLNASFLLSKLTATSMVKRRRESMTIELVAHNIQVNAIAPGWMETDMTSAAWTNRDANWSGFNQMILDRTPLHRWSKADEIA